MSTRTDVILVVKGAGEQEEDVHLNLFLRGFWSAIKSLDKTAIIAQVPPKFEDSSPSSDNEKSASHKHITEIHAKLPDPGGKRGKYPPKRIWLKESYWEYEVLPSGAFGNLLKEWKMSSHVFANMFQDIVFSRDSKWAKEKREKPQETDYPPTRPLDIFGNYVSYTLLFLLIFLPSFVADCIGNNPFKNAAAQIIPILTVGPSSLSMLYGVLFTLLLAMLWAIAPALEVTKKIALRKEGLKTLPGLPAWSLPLLILLLLSDPKGYLFVLIIVLLLQGTQLVARSILWKYRSYANSDVDQAAYYEYKHKMKGILVGKVQEKGLTRLAFSPLIYRYFLFLALPLAFVITALASLLKWTKILGGIGEGLDKFVKMLLIGYLDDVVNYATDPAQAHRVRSVIMEDIKYFHNLDEVQRIHVVAHSQGTPITFEALFHFIEPRYQEKVFTYVTLGSILSYYYQSRGHLDKIYHNRFQMPVRRRDRFPKEFKWMNFWNFTDPITEFYGLDEYAWFNGKWKDEEKTIPVRGKTSPVNIRTSSSLLKNHGEYWDNLDKLQIPLAKRVLGNNRPEEWNPDDIGRRKWHHRSVLFLWFFIVLLIGGVGYGIHSLLQAYPLQYEYFTKIGDGIKTIQTTLFPPDPEAKPSLWANLFNPVTLTAIKATWRDFSALVLRFLAAWAVYEWARPILDWLGWKFKQPNDESEKGEEGK